ncbi:YjbQ family protein [Caloranaerobacter sp. DY30410]|uniref:YjbQ family protein n=1 Tax=Caloranaerobacter sp. DY30410 TaxID=3238305 RepID=UPI003CFECA72
MRAINSQITFQDNVVVAITDGKLDFGPWEQIFYGEFDGKRRKRVLVKIIGE